MSAAKQFGRGRYLALAASIAVLLPGCAGQVREETLQAAEEVRKGPEAPPFRSITNFSVALRCMDNHMITFGVRDVSVLVEDLADQTKKVNAGTRDMLISAVSDMTKRSRAIRLVAYGQDSGNLIGFLKEAERKNAYSVIPQYDIKGSISQFDESVAKKDSSFGISFAEVFNYGRANVGNATILGIDLTVLNTEDLSVVPGVTSRNGVLIYKQGKGTDADAQYHKFGINFTTALSKAEGNSQALRNLVELAVIELFGKLTKVPYWTCLGADPKSEAVANEMADWYYTMTGDAAELIAYFQYQLSIRGYYNGPVDGASNPQLAKAITDLKTALGLQPNAKINQELFASYLNADHARLQADRARSPVAAPQPADPIRLTIGAAKGAGKFKRGETIDLTVKASRDAYVYCFLRDETKKVQRFFPNRFAKDALVSASEPLQLPGKMRFQLAASDKGIAETVACFAAPKEVLTALPDPLNAPDFEPMTGVSLEQLKTAFARAAGGGMGEASYNIEVR